MEARAILPLEDSYHYCVRLTRSRARNFYYSFLVLPRKKRESLCAIYAFMRVCDDITDAPAILETQGGEVQKKQEELQAWRKELSSALEGSQPSHPLWPAFIDTLQRYQIPPHYFYLLIDGTAMDLVVKRYQTFEDLYRYCYLVAGVVGLVTIHILGFDDPSALGYAEACGIAFQLTNILRDLREDAEMGRIYLPQEDLDCFGYSEGELKSSVINLAFLRLMAFEVNRAKEYYYKGKQLIPHIHPDSRPALSALIGIYEGLLDKIVKVNYDVFHHQVRLSALQKLAIAGKAWLKYRYRTKGRLSSSGEG